MNNKQGAVIIIATKPMQIYMYDKDVISQLANYKTVLIVDQIQHGKLDEDYLACFEDVHYVENAGTVDIFALHNCDTLRTLVSQYSTQYGPEHCFIFSTDEGNIERIAEATDGLHAFSEDFRYAPLFRDKIKMKAHVAEQGIRVPVFTPFTTDLSYETLSQTMGPTLIIKPIDSAGSVDVVKITSADDYQAFLATHGQQPGYQVEEFIEGTLYHVDSVKKDKKIAAYSISEYLYPVKEFTNGFPLASICLEETHPHYRDLAKFNELVLDTFPIDGSFHAEYFITPQGETVFLEIACRQAGPPAHHSFKHKTGYWQSALYLGLAMDVIQAENIQKNRARHFTTYIPSESGHYQQLNVPLSDTQYTIISEPNVGQPCTKPKSCFDKMAEIVIEAADHQALYQHFLTVRQHGKIGIFS